MSRKQVISFIASCLFFVVATGPYANLFAQGTTVAVVVDTSGTETELSELRSSRQEFAGRQVGGLGFSVATKKFSPGNVLDEWFFFSQVSNLSMNGDNVQIQLRDGSTVDAYRGLWWSIVGRFSLGEFTLESYKLKSLTVLQPPSQPQIPRLGGRRASVEFRDGTVLRLDDLVMYREVTSSDFYLVAPGTYQQRTSVFAEPKMWMIIARGAASVKMEITFEKISIIEFDTPDPKSNPKGDRIRLTLVDGTTFSGTCGGDGQREACGELSGITERGLVWLRVLSLGSFVRTLKFE